MDRGKGRKELHRETKLTVRMSEGDGGKKGEGEGLHTRGEAKAKGRNRGIEAGQGSGNKARPLLLMMSTKREKRGKRRLASNFLSKIVIFGEDIERKEKGERW